jgi:hypothetical protein
LPWADASVDSADAFASKLGSYKNALNPVGAELLAMTFLRTLEIPDQK